LPAFFAAPVTDPPKRREPVSPSDLGGAKALPAPGGLTEALATARGSYVHALLEDLSVLPQEAWPARIAATEVPPEITGALIEESRHEVQQVLTAPDLAWVFAPDTLAEVTVSGRIRGHEVMGVIDRLIVQGSRVIVVDYKTNLTVPDTPEHTPEAILRQMGAYAALLRDIYPGREIKTGILWTRTATYMSLPHSLVNEALARSSKLDVGGAAP
jgi:ATP-dependent helicase/nuclease subunit A